MTATEVLAACDAELRRLEAAMLRTQDPALFARLKAKHHDAQWRREVAAQQLAQTSERQGEALR